MRSEALFLGLFLAANVSVMADPPPEDFVGIKWGTPLAEAREKLSKREGLVPDDKASSNSRLRFTGGSFAGLQVDEWNFSFSSKGLFYASVAARDDSGGNPFDKLKQALAQKYGGGKAAAIGSRSRYYNWIMRRWENGSASKPSPNVSWHMQTSFTRQNIQIQCRPAEGKRVRVAYVNESLAETPQDKRSLRPRMIFDLTMRGWEQT